MDITVEQISELKTYFVDTLYNKVKREQEIDQQYYDDAFEVPEIKSPHHVYRSGLGVRIIDAPAEQIVTSNPQVFADILKGNTESGLKLSKTANNWVDVLRRQNPNPFKESVKNILLRGVNYIKVVHNESWVTGKMEKYGIPVKFILIDPMVIFASPEEDDNGIPDKVILWYKRQLSNVQFLYPDWSNPKNRRGKDSSVEWLEYYDKNVRYIEGDEEAITKDGIQENIYGFVPFVRKYSGFGRRSPDGEMANLIVSDIRRSRDLLREECAERSNIASILFLFAQKPLLITSPGAIDEGNIRENLSAGSYDINVIQNMPEGTKISSEEFGIEQPKPEMYKHHADVVAELNQRHPFIMAGFPFGSSGRQQDMTQSTAMRRYDTVVENTETAWASAFEMAFRICKAVPKLLPDGLSKKDLDSTYKCEVKLKAKDPIEEDRRITLGDRLWNTGRGSIDLETFHVEFQGRTREESKEIMGKMLADQVTFFDPLWAQVVGMEAAKEAGMEQSLEEATQMRQIMEAQEKGLRKIPATTTERVQGEVETPEGREAGIVGNRGARTPPERYNRGG